MKRERRLPWIVAVLAMLMLVGCAETDTARQAGPAAASPALSAAPVPPSSNPAATPSLAAAAPRVISPDADFYFTSPTRNISCQMTGSASTCDIREYGYAPPTPPADCDLDYGDMIQVKVQGTASFLCHGDTASTPDAKVLDYGQGISNGRFTCSSAESGITCLSTASRHGFALARAGHRLF